MFVAMPLVRTRLDVRIPYAYAAHVYGILQSAITTGVATAVATFSMSEGLTEFFMAWARNWILAWIAMLPIVITIAPILRRAVARLTADR